MFLDKKILFTLGSFVVSGTSIGLGIGLSRPTLIQHILGKITKASNFTCKISDKSCIVKTLNYSKLTENTQITKYNIKDFFKPTTEINQLQENS